MAPLLTYLAWSTATTFVGILFYGAAANVAPPGAMKTNSKYIALCAALSVAFTPLGAWFLSTLFRMKHMPAV
jgi:hypothetical protein